MRFFFTGSVSNITSDKETGLGNWTNAEIKRVITPEYVPNTASGFEGIAQNNVFAPWVGAAF